VIGLVGVNRELGKIGEILFARVFEPPLIDALALIQVNLANGGRTCMSGGECMLMRWMRPGDGSIATMTQTRAAMWLMRNNSLLLAVITEARGKDSAGGFKKPSSGTQMPFMVFFFVTGAQNSAGGCVHDDTRTLYAAIQLCLSCDGNAAGRK